MHALTSLGAPLSNANVERIISLVMVNNSKIRSRLSSEALDTIVRVQSHLTLLTNGNDDGCCSRFEVTKNMLVDSNKECMRNLKTKMRTRKMLLI